MRKMFSEIINYDINGYFDKFALLVNLSEQAIPYYTNKGTYPTNFFVLLDEVKRDIEKIYELISYRVNDFDSYKYTYIVDLFEDSVHSVELMDNYAKWLRSSFDLSKNTKQIQLRQNQTIESALSENNYSNTDDDFAEITINNRLNELDYSSKGGMTIKLSKIDKNSNSVININSVVDIITPDNFLGKEIYRKISFVEDDLVTLDSKSTFEQDVSILIALKRNENPEYAEDGMDKALLSNKNNLNYMLPIIIRQLKRTISSDDTIEYFTVKGVLLEKDALFISLEFKAKDGNIFNTRI